MEPPSDPFTFSMALLGAILGVLNTWRSFDRDRIRAKVVPAYLFSPDFGERLGITVTNLSWFPVTITDVVFTKRKNRKGESLVFDSYVLNGGSFPLRMEARTSITVVMRTPADEASELSEFKWACARTACGEEFYGTSGALKQIIRKLRRK